MLIKALKRPKSTIFGHESAKVWYFKINFGDAMVLKTSQPCPNRSRTSFFMIINTFWISKSDIRVTLKKFHETHPLKKIPTCWPNFFLQKGLDESYKKHFYHFLIRCILFSISSFLYSMMVYAPLENLTFKWIFSVIFCLLMRKRDGFVLTCTSSG